MATADSLGGKEYAVGTVQVSFPMGLPDEYQVRGHVFSDFGTMYGTDANEGIVQDCTCFRASIGFGVIWKSPFGPLAVDFAIPVAKASFDQTQVINFNVGTNLMTDIPLSLRLLFTPCPGCRCFYRHAAPLMPRPRPWSSPSSICR